MITTLIIIASIALSALMLACIWVASDTDDYNEQRWKDDE